MMKRWWIPLLTLLLVAAVAVPATAGVLTAGNYTYMLKGRELAVPVDILTVQGDTLVPQELLAALAIPPAVDGDAIALRRGPVTVSMTIGDEAAVVAGRTTALKAAPMQVNGRLFIPAEVLPDLGISLTVDGKFVLLRDYGPGDGIPGGWMKQADYDALMGSHTVKGMVRTDSGATANVAITRLTVQLLSDERLTMDWGTRLKLLYMLRDQSLFLVSVSNNSYRSVTLDPSKLLVTDDAGNQYDYQNSEIAVDGAVTAPIAPGATRSSVLVYTQTDAAVSLYYDTGNANLGRVVGP